MSSSVHTLAASANVTEYLCNGYDCDCGAWVKVISLDWFLPITAIPDFIASACESCGRTRVLGAAAIKKLPLVWIEQRDSIDAKKRNRDR